MSTWSNRIAEHPMWEALAAARAEVERAVPAVSDEPQANADLTRLQTVLQVIEARLRATDPLLLYPKPLGTIETNVKQLREAIATFQSTRDRTLLDTGNSLADTLLSNAAHLGLSPASGQAEVLDALNVVRDRSEELLRALTKEEGRLRDQVAKLQGDVQATTQEVSSQKGRLDSAIAEYQQQFSTAESARQSQATDALKTHAQRLDQAITDAQTRLQNSVQEANKRLDGAVTDGQKQLRDLLQSANERADAMLKEAAEKASTQHVSQEQSGKTVVDQLEDFREKAENLLHVIGSVGMAGEYQKVANRARGATIIWEIIAAVSMIGLIAFAVLTFSATQAGEINWGAVAARAFVAATFGILAAYAARQSEQYSEIEVGNRRYQLELSSIDPYLANLPADVQQTVKVELAQKLFGNASRAVGATSKKFSGTSKEPLELALGIILEFVKKRA
jgi:hypothetical protein